MQHISQQAQERRVRSDTLVTSQPQQSGMHTLEFYVVSTFSSVPFGGNTAGVVLDRTEDVSMRVAFHQEVKWLLNWYALY